MSRDTFLKVVSPKQCSGIIFIIRTKTKIFKQNLLNKKPIFADPFKQSKFSILKYNEWHYFLDCEYFITNVMSCLEQHTSVKWCTF